MFFPCVPSAPATIPTAPEGATAVWSRPVAIFSCQTSPPSCLWPRRRGTHRQQVPTPPARPAGPFEHPPARRSLPRASQGTLAHFDTRFTRPAGNTNQSVAPSTTPALEIRPEPLWRFLETHVPAGPWSAPGRFCTDCHFLNAIALVKAFSRRIHSTAGSSRKRPPTSHATPIRAFDGPAPTPDIRSPLLPSVIQ